MRIPIVMSQIGYGQETAMVLAWTKVVGDHVERGDVIVEVESEKVDMEIEALDSGTLVEIVCDDGETVAVGQVIAYLEDPGRDVEDRPGDQQAHRRDRERGLGSDQAAAGVRSRGRDDRSSRL